MLAPIDQNTGNNGYQETANPILAHPGLRALLQQQIAIRDGAAPAGTPAPAMMPSSSAAGTTAPPITPAPQPTAQPKQATQPTANEARLAQLQNSKPALENVYGKITSSDWGKKHQGLGRLAGIAGQIPATAADLALSLKGLPVLGNSLSSIGQVMPGTTEQHNAKLGEAQGAVNADEANAEKGAQTSEAQGYVPIEAATTAHIQQQTAAGVPVPPPDALVKDHPEIQGMMETPATWALMEKTFSGNQTRENTTNATVAGREQVAQTGAEAKKTVAQIAADERKSAEEAQDRTREAVARIRGASTGGGKGSANGVTNNSKARGEMSDTILQMAPTMLQEIDKLNEKIGPGAGRWNNFWVKKGGINDPDYAALDQDLGLYASALAVAHFGARGGGQHFIEGLKKDLSQAQSPEDLKARILHADKWLEGYQKEGRGEGGNPPAQGGGKQNDPLGIR